MKDLIVFIDADFPFQMFSAAHLVPLGLLLGLAAAIYILRQPLRLLRWNRLTRYVLTGLLAIQEVSYHAWAIWNGTWHAGYSLPLHLCGVSALLAGAMLITRSYRLFEVVYFWGLAGTSQALLTPDIGQYSFPHYMYYKFFLSHNLIILAVLFMCFVEQYRPTLASIGKVFVVTNFYAGLIAGVNYLTDGNYLYLCNKPAGASLLDYLGPWPWYIFSLEIIMILSCLLCYLPYMIGGVVKKEVPHVRN